MTKWTAKDEAALAAMLERKATALKEIKDPLVAFIADNMPRIGRLEADDVADWLIENVDHIRDLLEPFDSGVRQG